MVERWRPRRQARGQAAAAGARRRRRGRPPAAGRQPAPPGQDHPRRQARDLPGRRTRVLRAGRRGLPAARGGVPPPLIFTPAHRGGAGAPLVLLHGFLDTWRTWEPVLPALERRHDVLAPTLPGHAGGPPLRAPVGVHTLADAVERMMDEAGFAAAHLAGNSLGGHVALQLAARGRARTVGAFAPPRGWGPGDPAIRELFAGQRALHESMRRAAPFADVPVSPGADALLDAALREDWDLDAERIDCPVRIVWGTDDQLLRWPTAAVRYRTEWLPHADWVELDGVGHHPQLDVPIEAAQLILGYSSPS